VLVTPALPFDSSRALGVPCGGALLFDVTWNSLGQLTQATVNGVVTTYGYDGFDRRARKTVNGVATRYLWDDDNLVAELDGNGNPIREYSYYPGIDRPHAVRRSSDGAVFYYVSEEPGHVVGLVNASNQVVNTYEYEPFGGVVAQTEQLAQPFKFAGREYDAETGLYFMRSRYYDPQLARFISEDPIGIEGGLNVFAYVNDDPANTTDPYGLCGYLLDDDSDCAGGGGPTLPTMYITESRWPFSTPRNQGWTKNFGNPCARGGPCAPQSAPAPTSPFFGGGRPGPAPTGHDQLVKQCEVDVAQFVTGVARTGDVWTFGDCAKSRPARWRNAQSIRGRNTAGCSLQVGQANTVVWQRNRPW
jgi:RHS repeat-associated protein